MYLFPMRSVGVHLFLQLQGVSVWQAPEQGAGLPLKL